MSDAPAKARASFSANGSASYARVLSLSRGGMGEVSVAVRMEGAFQRLYAIKRLQPHLCDDEEVRKLFLDEARYAGLIRHANVVPVLDVGEDAEGPYLVMEYIQGLPLNQLLRKRRSVPVQVVVRIGIEIARGLHAAHELTDHSGRHLELVHRDISPQNILLGFDGVVRLTDFGIAKALGRSTRTQTGVLKGKFGYMAPEQLRFLPADRRSDLFSFGVVLFELFTSSRLYASRGEHEGPRRILYEAPPDLGDERPDVPDAIVALMFALLSKDPDERPQTAGEVADRLEETLAELVSDEGVVGLAHYMEDEFGDERAEMTERLAGALASAESPAIMSADPVELGGGDDLHEVRTIAAMPERTRRPLRWAGIALLAGIGVAATVVWLEGGATVSGGVLESVEATGQTGLGGAEGGAEGLSEGESVGESVGESEGESVGESGAGSVGGFEGAAGSVGKSEAESESAAAVDPEALTTPAVGSLADTLVAPSALPRGVGGREATGGLASAAAGKTAVDPFPAGLEEPARARTRVVSTAFPEALDRVVPVFFVKEPGLAQPLVRWVTGVPQPIAYWLEGDDGPVLFASGALRGLKVSRAELHERALANLRRTVPPGFGPTDEPAYLDDGSAALLVLPALVPTGQTWLAYPDEDGALVVLREDAPSTDDELRRLAGARTEASLFDRPVRVKPRGFEPATWPEGTSVRKTDPGFSDPRGAS